MIRHPIRQVAYLVNDVRASALAHHRLFGSGPYFVADNIPLRTCLHRGRPAPLDHTSAYGQWGDLMIEFVQQNNEGPSAFRDLYAPGEEGFHHVALIVDDLAETRAQFAADGLAEALYAEMNDGFAFVMVDGVARYGQMIELYEGRPALTGFYAMVRDAAAGFDGSDPVRTIRLG
ncbi:glyoxalase [Sphingomonas sp. DBB INV C78]|uniref:VOC family protein n=1 Tax=Sphingomonas sp. DBB INV C78 TaxID=3349434 RepID=UPI0036D429E2